MKNDLQSDLTADLLSDLARPTPLPSSVQGPPLPELPAAAGTPALALTLTPLRWSRPRLSGARHGHGVAVQVGPWRLEVAF